ncbi:M48 family metallopeptidase, partial [Ideonella sp.]|uniref:M48 family metallopeptidase n=1 Tax=Ideonella sp. TaxID=1929293 RepID=UPI003BB561C3
ASTVNAYATIGGRIVVFRGLLDRLESEDELLALLAHEMAHVQHRDVATSMGRGLALGLLLSLVSSDLGGQVAGQILGNTGGLMMLSYGREHERQADLAALQAVVRLQGHVGGVSRLWDRLHPACPAASQAGTATQSVVPEWLSSHPQDDQRRAHTVAWAQRTGVPLDGPQQPLSAALRAMQRPADACATAPS